MATPITDAINNQFDAWEAQVDKWQETKTKDPSKESKMKGQAQKLLNTVNEWQSKKIAELGSIAPAPTQLASTLQALQGSLSAVTPSPNDLGKMVTALKDLASLVGQIAQNMIDSATDITTAISILPSRTASLASKITGI